MAATVVTMFHGYTDPQYNQISYHNLRLGNSTVQHVKCKRMIKEELQQGCDAVDNDQDVEHPSPASIGIALPTRG